MFHLQHLFYRVEHKEAPALGRIVIREGRGCWGLSIGASLGVDEGIVGLAI